MSETVQKDGRYALGLLPARLVIQGDTDQVRFLGRQGLGFRVRTIAHGTVQGYPDWPFWFRESVTVSLFPFRLTNWGLMSIDAPQGRLTVSFRGRVRILKRMVIGDCTALGTEGQFDGLRGRGTYTGDAGLRFQVTFLINWPQA